MSINGTRERRFSQEQYDMLKRCSDAKDMTEWNEWRVNNPEKDVLLERATLDESYLEGALLNKWWAERDNEEYDFKGEVHLENANLVSAHLENANLVSAHLENVDLASAHLENVNLASAHLEKADLQGAHLENANLLYAHLENADLRYAHLENAKLWFANLQGARFLNANLAGVDLMGAKLQGADCSRAIVDGKTLIWECKIDKETKFEGVGLGIARIYPKTKQLLEYNIRRMNWEDWYKEHWLLRWPVQAFWAMSDYGISTLRVVGVFFILALLFAAVYVNWAYWQPPGIVSNLIVQPEAGEAALHYFWRALIRPVYFSVVTMTTLGFGDMYANKGSIAGHVLLILQVILGYVLLGALITRFAVLFTAGGPAGRFAEEKKESTK